MLQNLFIIQHMCKSPSWTRAFEPGADSRPDVPSLLHPKAALLMVSKNHFKFQFVGHNTTKLLLKSVCSNNTSTLLLAMTPH